MTETVSYTRQHPVAVTLECAECQVTLAGDNVPDALREMFEERHAGCLMAEPVQAS